MIFHEKRLFFSKINIQAQYSTLNNLNPNNTSQIFCDPSESNAPFFIFYKTFDAFCFAHISVMLIHAYIRAYLKFQITLLQSSQKSNSEGVT